MKKKLFLILTLLLCILNVYSQERTVSGKVSSAEDGKSQPGVTIVIKGTTVGVISDADGNYSLPLSEPKGILVFSFIGKQSL